MSENLRSILPLFVGDRKNLKCDSASIYFGDGDQCAEVHGNIAAMPEPISAQEMAEYIVTAVNSRDALVEALKELRSENHSECNDSWYSCPKSEIGCSDDGQGEECNCGTDARNLIIDAALKLAGVE